MSVSRRVSCTRNCRPLATLAATSPGIPVQLVLSVQCELVSIWQSSAHDQPLSSGKHLPLRQDGGAVFVVSVSVDEMTFEGEVVVERSVNRSEFLQ